MKIAKLMARVPGLTVRMVHYWNQQGWFGPEASGQGRHLDYTEDDVKQAVIAMMLIKKVEMGPKYALHIGRRLVALNISSYCLDLGNDYKITIDIPMEEYHAG